MTNPVVLQNVSGEGLPPTDFFHNVAATFPARTAAGNAIVAFSTTADFAGVHTGLSVKDKQGNTYALLDQENAGGNSAQTIASYLAFNIAGDTTQALIDNTNSASVASASSLTWNYFSNTWANCLVVTEGNQAAGGGVAPTGITYAGVAMTLVTGSGIINGQFASSIWYLMNPTHDSNNIVVTYPSSRVAAGASAIGLVGVSTATPVGSPTTASGSNVATAAVTATGGVSGGFYVGAVVLNATTVTSGGSQTNQTYNPNIASAVSTAQDTRVGAGAGAFTWTGSGTTGSGWAATAVIFNADATAGDVLEYYYSPDSTEDYTAMYALEVGGVSASPLVGHSGSVQNGLSPGTNNILSGTMTVTSGQVPCLLLAMTLNGSFNGGVPNLPTPGTGMTFLASTWTFGGAIPCAALAYRLITTAGSYQAVFNQVSSASEDINTVAVILQGAAGAALALGSQICL
jgi:hypothetical protein